MTRSQLTTRVLKPLAFVAALGPAEWLVWAGVTGRLIPDPLKAAQVLTGTTTLVLLLLTLSVTPLRRLTGWNELIKLRRMLGLFAFFYVLLHATAYFVFDQSLDPTLIWQDSTKHPRIFVGFAAFLLLIPLALTSTDKMVRRLGKRWGKLHKLVYLATALGVLHFLMVQKLDLRKGLAYAAVFALLMLFRLGLWLYKNRAELRAARVERAGSPQAGS